MDRMMLRISEVGEPKEVGTKGARKLSFKAKDSQGKELSYFTFRSTLFEAIKPGTTIDAEVDVKSKEVDGNTYIDRQVNQIFVDGNPIGGEKKQWQPRGDSPEQRRSIERQVAAKLALEFSKEISLVDKLCDAETIFRWISEGKLPVSTTAPGIVATAPVPLVAQPKSDSNGIIAKQGELLTFSTATELVNYAMKRGVSWEAIKKALVINVVTDIKDIPAATSVLIPLIPKKEP